MKIRNAKRKPKFVSRPGPNRVDPTRTATMRRALSAELSKRFARLRLDLYRLIVDEDALGLREQPHTIAGLTREPTIQPLVLDNVFCPTGEGGGIETVNAYATANARWSFLSLPEKVRAFTGWLRERLGRLLRSASEEQLLHRYAEAGLRKGAARSFDDAMKSERIKAQLEERLDFYAGTREQFLRSAFTQPVAIEKVALLASRSFADLKGVTEDMATKLQRTLTDGLVQGKSPRDVARDLMKVTDLSKQRALVIARTEIVRAHADGQLLALEQLGVEEVGVAVEWTTAGDNKVCPQCRPLEGVVLTLEEAKGLIPRHPQCRCAWVPAGVGESSRGQTASRSGIARALLKSAKAGKQVWPGGGFTVAKKRPKGVTNRWEPLWNAFCPTGKGGGIDPTCTAGGKKSGSGYSTEELRAMSPAQRRALAGIVMKIKTKGMSDEQVYEALAPKSPSIPSTTVAPTKLPSAERAQAVRELIAPSRRGEEVGGADPRGDLSYLPSGDRYSAAASSAEKNVVSHARAKTVGIGVADLYQKMAQDTDLSSREFRAVLLDLHRSERLRLSGWSRMPDDLPRPDLAPVVSSKIMGYVNVGSKLTGNARWQPMRNVFCPTGDGGGD